MMGMEVVIKNYTTEDTAHRAQAQAQRKKNVRYVFNVMYAIL